jgi:hypothetical protein
MPSILSSSEEMILPKAIESCSNTIKPDSRPGAFLVGQAAHSDNETLDGADTDSYDLVVAQVDVLIYAHVVEEPKGSDTGLCLTKEPTNVVIAIEAKAVQDDSANIRLSRKHFCLILAMFTIIIVGIMFGVAFAVGGIGNRRHHEGAAQMLVEPGHSLNSTLAPQSPVILRSGNRRTIERTERAFLRASSNFRRLS